MSEYSSQKLLHSLHPLKLWQWVAFSAALTERMLPNFLLFSRLTDFGDPERLRLILDGVWDSLIGAAKMNFGVQLDHVEANMPSLDTYDMYGAMPALDAVVALYSTLMCILEKEAVEASSIGQLSRETVAIFIRINVADPQLSDEELNRFIATHPLMQAEEAFQQDILDQLATQSQPNKAFIQRLRTLATHEGVSNLGIQVNDDT